MYSKSIIILASMLALSFAAPLPNLQSSLSQNSVIDESVPIVSLAKRADIPVAPAQAPINHILSIAEFKNEFPQATSEIYNDYRKFMSFYPSASIHDFVTFAKFHDNFPTSTQADFEQFMNLLNTSPDDARLFESSPYGANQVFAKFSNLMRQERQSEGNRQDGN